VGLLTDLGQIGTNMLPLVGLLLLVAVISKVVGGGLGALLGGFDLGASFRLGVCRVSRGEVGLIIASLGLSNGLLSRDLFQPIFLVVLLTTILTPPMVRWTFKNRSPQSARV
jgi:Kef-type K+ transport system membrane component KefB